MTAIVPPLSWRAANHAGAIPRGAPDNGEDSPPLSAEGHTPGRPAGLLPLARPRPAAGRQAAPGAPARPEGPGPAGEAPVPARRGGLAQRPRPGHRAAAAVAGTRIAEITALDVADVRLSARKGEIHLVGKDEKARTVPVHPKLRAALAAWLDERPARRGAGSAALFTSVRGTRMTTDAIADVLTAITRAAGPDDHVTSHVLRHTFGTELKMGRIASGASFRTSREHALPAAQRAALRRPRPAGASCGYGDLGLHDPPGSDATMMRLILLRGVHHRCTCWHRDASGSSRLHRVHHRRSR